MADPQAEAQPFEKVLEAELKEVRAARWKRFMQSLRAELRATKKKRTEEFRKQLGAI